MTDKAGVITAVVALEASQMLSSMTEEVLNVAPVDTSNSLAKNFIVGYL